MLIDVVRANTPTGPQNIVIKRATSPAEIAKLEREAEILVGVGVEGIVQRVNTTVPVAGNGMYMLRVEGLSLAEYNNLRGPLLPIQVAGVVAQLCQTLSAMHQRGIAHGAIDATHVLLRADGAPVICSWGRVGHSPADDCRAIAQMMLDQLQPTAASMPSLAPDSDADVRARLILLEVTDEIIRRPDDSVPTLGELGQLIATHIPDRQFASVTTQAATEIKESRIPEADVPLTSFAEMSQPSDEPLSNQTIESERIQQSQPTFDTPQPPIVDQIFVEPSHFSTLAKFLIVGVLLMLPVLIAVTILGFRRGGDRAPNEAAIPPVSTTMSPTTTTAATTTTTFVPLPSTSLPGVIAGSCAPANDGFEIDYNGDGCPEATSLTLVDSVSAGQPVKVLTIFVIDANGTRQQVAQVSGTSSDDQFTAGDWSGKGIRTPGLWLARSRCVYVYDSWSKTDPARAISQTDEPIKSLSNAPTGKGRVDHLIVTDNQRNVWAIDVPKSPSSPASDVCA